MLCDSCSSARSSGLGAWFCCLEASKCTIKSHSMSVYAHRIEKNFHRLNFAPSDHAGPLVSWWPTIFGVCRGIGACAPQLALRQHCPSVTINSNEEDRIAMLKHERCAMRLQDNAISAGRLAYSNPGLQACGRGIVSPVAAQSSCAASLLVDEGSLSPTHEKKSFFTAQGASRDQV